MRTLLFACMAMVLAACAAAPTQSVAPPSRFAYAALTVSDVEASAAWYARTFDLREVNRASSDTYDVRVLRSDELMVELIELTPAGPAPAENGRGISKFGFEITGWDQRIAAWRAAGVRFFNDRVLFDEALQLHNVIIEDPDGNMIQIYARAES